MPDARISTDDIEFDDEGRAFITNPKTVAQLRGGRAKPKAKKSGGGQVPEEAALKNLGCCSVTAATEFAELANEPRVAEALTRIQDELALKNIGCCSVTDVARDQGISPSRIQDEVALKNIGCCKITDLGDDVS